MKSIKSNPKKVLTREELKTISGAQKPAVQGFDSCEQSCASLGYFVGQMRDGICYCFGGSSHASA